VIGVLFSLTVFSDVFTTAHGSVIKLLEGTVIYMTCCLNTALYPAISCGILRYPMAFRHTLAEIFSVRNNNKVTYKQHSVKKTQDVLQAYAIQSCGTGVPSGVVH